MRASIPMIAAAFVLVAGAASADDLMATTYGNTVTTKNVKTGAVGQLFFNADGTYTAKATGANGQPVEIPGSWVVKGNGATLCMMPQMPTATPNPPAPNCSPLGVHPVGEHWTVSNDQGDSFDVVVSTGR